MCHLRDKVDVQHEHQQDRGKDKGLDATFSDRSEGVYPEHEMLEHVIARFFILWSCEALKGMERAQNGECNMARKQVPYKGSLELKYMHTEGLQTVQCCTEDTRASRYPRNIRG